MTRDERTELKGQINRDLDIIALADEAGLARDHKGRGPGYVCPGWGNENCGSGSGPNGTGLHHYPDANTLYCFKCGHTFTPVDMLAYMHNGDYSAALADGAERIGADRHTTPYRPKPSKTPVAAPQARERCEPTQDYADYLARARDALTDDSEGAAYLAGRGLRVDTARAHGIGYDERTHRLIIPTGNGGYIARATDGATPKMLNAAGYPVAPSFTASLRESGPVPVHIVEGFADALAVYDAGGRAVSLNGTSNVPRLTTMLDDIPDAGLPPFILAMDPDSAGARARDALASYMDTRGVRYVDGTICLTDRDGTRLDPADSRAFDPPAFAAAVRADCAQATAYPETAARKAAEAVAGTDVLIAQFKEMRDRIALGHVSARISTGLAPLDAQLGGGLYPGLIIVGGRTGTGKTTLALQIADSIAAAGRMVLYVALEMSREELYAKSLARIGFDYATEHREDTTAPSYEQILEGALRDRTWGAYPCLDYERDIAPRMMIHESIGQTTAETVRALAKTVRTARGEAPVVIVDYLQIMGAADPRRTDKQNADANTLALKQLSRDMNTPVIALSSLNRAGYAVGGKYTPITEASFKESGGIEYTADMLIALERTDETGPTVDPKNIQIKLLKNRRGPCRLPTGYEWYGGQCLFTPYGGAIKREGDNTPLY